jgi:hypothetical protein
MGFSVSYEITEPSNIECVKDLRDLAAEGDIFQSIDRPHVMFMAVYLYGDYRKPEVESIQFLRLDTAAVEIPDGYLFPLRKLERGTKVTLTVHR